MPDLWLCGSCRSLNEPSAKRCYHCREPRERVATATLGAAATGTDWAPGAGPPPTGMLPLFGRYRTARARAALAAFFILVVVILDALVTIRSISVTASADPDISFAEVERALNTTVDLSISAFVAFVLAGIAWVFWFNRVIGNLPALGGGYPTFGRLGAIVWWFIPIVSWWKPPRALSEVYRRLATGRSGGGGLISAWWITWILTDLIGRVGPLVAAVLILRFEMELTGLLLLQIVSVISLVWTIVLTVCGILAISIVADIQRFQSARANTLREYVLTLPDASAVRRTA